MEYFDGQKVTVRRRWVLRGPERQSRRQFDNPGAGA
jgi:hypothetical protein